MRRLYDRLPDRVTVGERTYKLDLDFRNVMRMMDILARDDILPGPKEYLALRCVMKRRPPKDCRAVLSAVSAMLFGTDITDTGGERVTSFEQDADMIRAAFLQCFGINLYRDKLHWFEFQALVQNIPGGCKYMDVLNVRTQEIPAANKYNAKEREAIMKAKARYALKISPEERKRNYENAVHSVFRSMEGLAKSKG